MLPARVCSRTQDSFVPRRSAISCAVSSRSVTRFPHWGKAEDGFDSAYEFGGQVLDSLELPQLRGCYVSCHVCKRYTPKAICRRNFFVSQLFCDFVVASETRSPQPANPAYKGRWLR